MRDERNRSLGELPGDEAAEATAEWLMVAAVCILLAWVTDAAATIILKHLFARSAAIIASPFG